MSWLARYEEGFVTKDGDVVSITNKVHGNQTWESPTIALTSWLMQLRRNGELMGSYRNGFQQIDDVSAHPDFAGLGVARIWRRVSFELLSDATAESRSQSSMPGRDGGLDRS